MIKKKTCNKTMKNPIINAVFVSLSIDFHFLLPQITLHSTHPPPPPIQFSYFKYNEPLSKLRFFKIHIKQLNFTRSSTLSVVIDLKMSYFLYLKRKV